MELRSIKINDTGDRQYIALGEKDGDRTLTIVIGYGEVQAIDRFVKGLTMQRPMTHDLMVALVRSAGAEIERVAVTELKDGTFFASIRMVRADGGMAEVDARPSDAIALAVAVKKPIFVDDAVLRDAAIL
ncbi:MAG: bifunctional nuclease family protein [Planctomycetota bacterium]|jgi:bifunctional DNase/RNase